MNMVLTSYGNAAIVGSSTLLIQRNSQKTIKRVSNWISRSCNLSMILGSLFFLLATIADLLGTDKSPYMYMFCALFYLIGAIVSSINYEVDVKIHENLQQNINPLRKTK